MSATTITSECLSKGACSCAFLLDCSAREVVLQAALDALPQLDEVQARWQDHLVRRDHPPNLTWPRAQLQDLVNTLAQGDAPMIAAAVIQGARFWIEAGVPIHRAMVAAQLLASSLLSSGPAAAAERLGWLLASVVGVAYGAEVAAVPGAGVMPVQTRAQFCGLVGASQIMRSLYARIELAARGRETILIAGESGVGKELVARAIHQAAGEPSERFVPVNCAALPRDLLESELFGHRRGAFSGAGDHHLGLIRSADGGTLFLDEITELAPEAQAKLLRVIQERCVRGVGELRESPVQVRIVAATNRDPIHALEGGRLRRDLYYRLQRLVIEVPPLRRRVSDLPLLVATFCERWAAAYSEARPKSFSTEALERLCGHEWPGNVRELENVVFASCLAAAGPLVHADDLPPFGATRTATEGGVQEAVSMQDAERRAIEQALSRAVGNKSLAARMLGISRKQLYAKIDRYGLIG